MKKAFFAVLAASSAIAVAEPPQSIDIHNLPGGANVVDHVVIPVPTEIFNVLDRLGKPKWAEVLRPVKNPKVPSERIAIALLLGNTIAEGFVAVEATNVQEVKNIGNAVIKLSKALNVESSVTKRANAIIENADKQQWKQVRKELDAAQHDAESAMHDMQDDDLAQLVSLGGWLRGLEALSTVVDHDYLEDAADLMHQPVLLDYFDKRLANMPKKIKDNELVSKIRAGLARIRPLISADNKITPKVVKDVKSLVEDLVKDVNPKP